MVLQIDTDKIPIIRIFTKYFVQHIIKRKKKIFAKMFISVSCNNLDGIVVIIPKRQKKNRKIPKNRKREKLTKIIHLGFLFEKNDSVDRDTFYHDINEKIKKHKKVKGGKIKMDQIDVKLLSAMEQNSRISLKHLAKDLDVKTSTIYHRLHKLKESNILERFTIVINPEEIGLNVHALFHIRLKKMVIGKLDSMFLESFAKFLSDQFPEVLFSSVGDDDQIHIIASFRDEAHFKHFIKTLNENPYIDRFSQINFSKILKGKKIFSFIANQHPLEEEGEMFDDDEAVESEDTSVSKEYSVQF